MIQPHVVHVIFEFQVASFTLAPHRGTNGQLRYAVQPLRGSSKEIVRKLLHAVNFDSCPSISELQLRLRRLPAVIDAKIQEYTQTTPTFSIAQYS